MAAASSYTTLCLSLTIILCVLVPHLQGSVPIPPVPHGVVYNNGRDTAPLQLEQFGEVLCSDVKAAWRILKPLADYYGPTKLRLKVYQFPLPYHQYAFLATQVGLLVKDLSPHKFIEYLEAVMETQQTFLYSNVINLTQAQALAQFAEIAERVTGLPRTLVAANVGNYSWAARAEWKFGAARGVSGTPTYFINGVQLVSTPRTIWEWRSLFDELLRQAGYSTTPTRRGGNAAVQSSIAHIDESPSHSDQCTPSPDCTPKATSAVTSSMYPSALTYFWLMTSLWIARNFPATD